MQRTGVLLLVLAIVAGTCHSELLVQEHAEVQRHAVRFFSAVLHDDQQGTSLIEKADDIHSVFSGCPCHFGESWRDPTKEEFQFPGCPAITDESDYRDVSVERVIAVEWLVFPAFNFLEPNPQLAFVVTPLSALMKHKILKREVHLHDFNGTGLLFGEGAEADEQKQRVSDAADVIIDAMENKSIEFRLELVKRIAQAANIDGILREAKTPNWKLIAQRLARGATSAFRGAQILAKTTIRGVVCVLKRALNHLLNLMRRMRKAGVSVYTKLKASLGKVKSAAARVGRYMAQGASRAGKSLKSKMTGKKKIAQSTLSPSEDEEKSADVFLETEPHIFKDPALRDHVKNLYGLISGAHEGTEVDDDTFHSRLALIERSALSVHSQEKVTLNALQSIAAAAHPVLTLCLSDGNLQKGALQIAVNVEFPSFSNIIINAASGNFIGAMTAAVPEILASIIPVPYRGHIVDDCSGSAIDTLIDEVMDEALDGVTSPDHIAEVAEDELRNDVGAAMASNGNVVNIDDDVAAAPASAEEDEIDMSSSLFEEARHLFHTSKHEHLKELDAALLEMHSSASRVHAIASSAKKGADDKKGSSLKDFLTQSLDVCLCDFENSWDRPTQLREWQKQCPAEKIGRPLVGVSRTFAVEWGLFPSFAVTGFNPMLGYGIAATEHLVEDNENDVSSVSTVEEKKLSPMSTPAEIAKHSWKWAVQKVKGAIAKLFEKSKLMFKVIFKGLVCVLYQAWDRFKDILRVGKSAMAKIAKAVAGAPAKTLNAVKRVKSFLYRKAVKMFHKDNAGSADSEKLNSQASVFAELAATVSARGMKDAEWESFLETAESEFLSVKTYARTLHGIVRSAVKSRAQQTAKTGAFSSCMSDVNVARKAVAIAFNIEFPNYPEAVSKMLLGNTAAAARALVPELLLAIVPVQYAIPDKTGDITKRFAPECLAGDATEKELEETSETSAVNGLGSIDVDAIDVETTEEGSGLADERQEENRDTEAQRESEQKLDDLRESETTETQEKGMKKGDKENLKSEVDAIMEA